MDENHLFEAMGLTVAGEQKLQEIFDPQLNDYLKTQMILTDSTKEQNYTPPEETDQVSHCESNSMQEFQSN